MIKKSSIKENVSPISKKNPPSKKMVSGNALVKFTKAIALVSIIVFIATLAFAAVKPHNSKRAMHLRDKRMGIETPNMPIASSGMEPMMQGEVFATDQAMEMKSIAPNAEGDAVSSDAMEARIIKTGNISANVSNINESIQSLQNIASQLEGNTFSSSVYQNGNGTKSGSISIKIPARRFEEAMQLISQLLPNITNQSTGNQDITSEYIDLQARLQNKQAEESAFAAILEKNSEDVESILAVTKELSRVRGEIEQIQSQVKYLESQTDMSIITISLTEDARVKPADNSWRPLQEVKNAAHALIQNLQGLLTFLIRFAIIALPIIIILLLTFGLAGYWAVKKLYQWLNK